MVKTRNRLIAAFLTLAMLFNFSAPLAAYADDEVKDETVDRTLLTWDLTHLTDPDVDAIISGSYPRYETPMKGSVSITFPEGTSEDDIAAVTERLKDILDWQLWVNVNGGAGNTTIYPRNLIVDGKEVDGITDSESFQNYVNSLLQSGDNPLPYHFGTLTSGGAISGDGVHTDSGSTETKNDQKDSDKESQQTPGNSSGSGSITDSFSEAGLGTGSIAASDFDLGAVSAPDADSDPICDLITVAGLFAVASQLAIGFNWDALPIHKVEGTLTDANGAAVANATVTLEKDGKTVKSVTSDASGHFKAYVPQGEYNLFATMGEKTAIYTAYTADEGISADLLLQDSE